LKDEANLKARENKLIILAGAGSTSDLGYPTLDDLMYLTATRNDDAGKLIIDTHNELKYKKKTSAEFEALIGKLKDYQDIANKLSIDGVLKELCQPNQRILDGIVGYKFYEALTKCYRILAESYGPKAINRTNKAYSSYPGLLEEVSKQNNHSLDIYTTNYDCSYQVLASNFSNISFLTHISNKDDSFKDTLWYHTRKDLEGKALPEVYIHRLHGCIAWFNMPDKGGGPSNAHEKAGSGDVDNPPITDAELHNMCIKLVSSPVFGTNSVFRSAFDEFYQHLKGIKTLLVWGYSFRDLEVTRIINDALHIRENDPFDIYYIDPYLTEKEAAENIKQTLSVAPVEKANHFKPMRVKWTPDDGYEDLTGKIVAITKEAYR